MSFGTYPLSSADLNGSTFSCEQLVNSVNTAFYEGFLLAICRTKESFDSIDFTARIAAIILATEALCEFQPERAKELQARIDSVLWLTEKDL